MTSHERIWKAGDVIPSWGCRPLSAREAEDLNVREGKIPDPKDRLLTAQERMWLRHLLQMLSEQSRTVRDSIVPGNGLKITAEVWADQWEALTKEMDEYTKKLSSGKGPVAVTKYLDHNE